MTELGMFHPEVTRRVREGLPVVPHGPQSWQQPLNQTFGTQSQRSQALRMSEHVQSAQTITDLEPTLCVYHWNPPVGFHLVVVDPFSRAAVELWPGHTPQLLFTQLCQCLGLDREPGPGYEWWQAHGSDGMVIREVPIAELL